MARWSLTKVDAATRARLAASWKRTMADVAGASPAVLTQAVALPSQAERERLAQALGAAWDDLVAA